MFCYSNMFLDGSLFSEGAFAWVNDEERTETLLNQLYLRGSLMSRNTIGGSSYEDEGEYPKGDGSSTADYDEAVDYDLNMIRQFRRCYEIDEATGLPDVSLFEDCGEGEELSSYRDENGDSIYSPFVVEYSPAEDLPIFTVESGLFN